LLDLGCHPGDFTTGRLVADGRGRTFRRGR
jgi:hypothetical protein